ncbi:early endosome antigen 1-like [Periplaneta americana]|uniref:early endosome antigen 1-like n=1 Tax=Periplaneta americana TaxID=6978 RepID=UPI0037E7A90B
MMFTIKNIVNKITDRGRESQPNSPGRDQGDDLSKQAAEGFLCPKCMKAFPSPEELQSHYVSTHDGDGEAAISDLPAVGNTPGFLSLHQEVGEHYKREDGNSIHDSFGIDVLGITDLDELKKRLIESLESRALLQQEKERLEQRAAQLARDNVTLKAASDEGEGNQVALKERLKVVEAQLAHRESIDDAAVLRQELVQVQRVMDELTREKERERDQLKAELQELKDKYARDVSSQTKSASNIENQRRLEELEELIRNKNSLIMEMEVNVNTYKTNIDSMNTKLQQEFSRSQMLEEELSVQKQKLSEAVEECQKKNNDFQNWQDKYDEVKKERDQLKDSMQKLQQNGANEVKTLTQQFEDMKLKCDTALKQSEEKEEGLKSTQALLDALNKQKDILKSELIHKSKVCEEFDKTNIMLNEKVVEAEKALTQKKEEISRLEAERAELLVQIQAGEGANTAIQQLSQEKVLLSNQLKEQIQNHASYVEEMKRKLDRAETQIQELNSKNKDLVLQISNQENKIQTISKELKESHDKVVKLIDEVNKKDDDYQQLKSSKDHLESLKTTYENRIAELESLVKDKSSMLSEYSDQIQTLKETVQINQTRVAELETKNNTISEGLKERQSKVVDLETNLTISEENLTKSLTKMKDLESELEKKSSCISQLEAENTNITGDCESLRENIKDKEEQIKLLGVQKASLETSLFELAAQMEEDKKKIEDTWKRELDSLKATFQESQDTVAKLEASKEILLSEKAEMIKQITLLEEKLEKLQKNAQEEITALQNQLSTQTSAKETVEKELDIERNKNKGLEKDMAGMKESYENEIEKKIQQLKDVHASLDEVAGEKLALEAQLAASQSEQQALLERCYASSAESENLRKTIADLRRRLEESQAALHELGRENQTLQLELEKLGCRKWTEDSDVISCSLCQKEFSLIVRKHHCRNCGQIFCNECSSKNAPIASNKKPVRVCDSCFNELGSK